LSTISGIDTKDVIEEAIEFFRANILFRSYEPQGAGDLLVCYLTIYFSEILRFLHKSAKTVADARKSITQISHAQNFGVPGESTFCLSGFFAAPASRTEGELARNYLLQLRQEAALRFVEAVYNPDGTQNKWWFQFNRRKFMNIDHA
jgi:actin related protein 2/3 complex subunit 3